MPSKNLNDSYFTLRVWNSDTSALVTTTMKIGQGNFTWTEAQTIEYTPNRGRIAPQNDGGSVRQGDDVPMAVSFDIVFEEYESSTGYSPVELLHSPYRASEDDTCGPSSVDIILDTSAECDTANNERLIFPRFRWENISYDVDQGQISCSGNCLSTEPAKVAI